MSKEQFFTALTYKICIRSEIRAHGSNSTILCVLIEDLNDQ